MISYAHMYIIPRGVVNVQCSLCTEFDILLLLILSLFLGQLCPFLIIMSTNSLCAEFVAGSISCGSIPLTASCAILHQIVDKLWTRR